MSRMKVEDVERVDPVVCVGNPDDFEFTEVSPLPPSHIPPYEVLFTPPVFPDIMRFELTCTECDNRSVVIISGSLGLSPQCAICRSVNFDVNYISETDSDLPLNELIN